MMNRTIAAAPLSGPAAVAEVTGGDAAPMWLACPCGEAGCISVCPHQDERGPEAAACDCHCCEAAERAILLELEAPGR
jgi:hypothetical protein